DALAHMQAKVQQNGKLGDWLQRHGLSEAAPLWRSLQVEPGWETAVEAVLRERFSATLVESAETVPALLSDAAPASVAVGVAGVAAAAAARPERGEALSAKVRCTNDSWHGALADWLCGIYVAEDLGALLPRRGDLAADELWVNRAGQTLSRHAVTLYAPDVRTHGVIERQREIDDLSAAIDGAQEHAEQTRAAVAEAESALASHQDRQAAARREAQDLQAKRHDAQLQLLKLQQSLARYQERVAQIERDLGEVTTGEQQERERHLRAEAEIARQRELTDVQRDRLDTALETQRSRDLALREARSTEQVLAREVQEASFSERECSGKLEGIAKARELAREQLARIVGEQATAVEERAGIDEERLESALEAALELRLDREQSLTRSREGLEEISERLRQSDEARLKIEQGLGPLRDRIGDLKLKAQAAQLNEEQFSTRLAEAQADEAALAPRLTRELKESVLVGTLARLNQEIADLGAVNLAALEELTTARERKTYLDAQSADLNQAISTLEDAIRRIDRETREQLRTTYETVNRHFGVLFPELFGGGEARLVLTGDEILDAGVHVVAQPPGKKNASIHLLSGGEKALTAIALVFSFFQLNPAPFCLLDEVDAPLDDSNTERFCDMVKRMSQQTQFLYISHNKITMEMAQQLIGVTMQEQGVSRVVEVDIEEALRLQQEAAA
ncbi:MAG: chromosome segregation protein SMC, partial [Rhodocyclaceae bacterium]